MTKYAVIAINRSAVLFYDERNIRRHKSSCA